MTGAVCGTASPVSPYYSTNQWDGAKKFYFQQNGTRTYEETRQDDKGGCYGRNETGNSPHFGTGKRGTASDDTPAFDKTYTIDGTRRFDAPRLPV